MLLGETLRVMCIDSPAFQRLGWIPDPAKEGMHGVLTVQASGYVEVGNWDLGLEAVINDNKTPIPVPAASTIAGTAARSS